MGVLLLTVKAPFFTQPKFITMIANTIKSILLGALLVGFTQTANAQTKKYEIGLKANSLNNFGLLYKLERAENKFLRLSAGFNTAWSFGAPTEVFSVGHSFSVGFERRVGITDKFQFLHGIMPGVGLRYSLTTFENLETHELGGSVNLGYIIGFQYNFAKSFYVGLETIPTVSVGTRNLLNSSSVNVGASIRPNVGVTFIYQFEK